MLHRILIFQSMSRVFANMRGTVFHRVIIGYEHYPVSFGGRSLPEPFAPQGLLYPPKYPLLFDLVIFGELCHP